MVGHKTLIACFVASAALVGFVGCGDDKKNPVAPGGGTPATTDFVGIASDGINSGKLTITVNTTSLTGGIRAGALHAATVVANGNLKIRTTTITLTGTYDPDLDSLHLAGAGWTMSGELLSDGGSDRTLLGQAAGPGGPGFFLTGHLAGPSLKIYTGVYFSYVTGDSGTWDMITQADTLFVVRYKQGDPEPIYLNGYVSGSPPDRNVSAYGGSFTTFDISASGILNTFYGFTAGNYTFVYHDVLYYPDDYGVWNGSLMP